MCKLCRSLFTFCTFLFDHCVVCCSPIYRFCLPLWFLLTIVLSVVLQYTNSDYSFGFFWPLCCLLFSDIQILFTWFLLTIVLSVVLRYTDSVYPFGFFWPLCCLLFSDIQIMFTPLVSVDHCVVCCSPIYRLCLPLWFLLTIVLSVVLRYTDYVYPFGFFKLFLYSN
jgi:preprotein translocase subunit SecG